MGLSIAQRRALAILPKVSGSLSLISSSIVVYSILKCPRKRGRIYHRLLLLISAIDCIASFFWGLSTWPVPASSGAMYAVGNERSCNFQGFFLQTTITSPVCNCALAIYYLLYLKYDWHEKQLRKYERLMYTIPLLFGFGTAIMGVPLKLYNNANLWCWIASYPAGCEGDSCIRGANANNYRWAIYYGPLWMCLLIVTFCQLFIFQSLKKHISTKSEIGFEIKAQDEKMLTEAELDNLREREAYRKMYRGNIIVQCFLYAASFYFTWFCLTSVRVLQALEKPVPYQLIASACFLTPLQGIPNLMIYSYPRFMQEKKKYPSAGLFTWIRNALFKDV